MLITCYIQHSCHETGREHHAMSMQYVCGGVCVATARNTYDKTVD